MASDFAVEVERIRARLGFARRRGDTEALAEAPHPDSGLRLAIVRIPEGDGMLGLASGALGQEIQPLPAAPGGLVPEDSVTREGEDRVQFSIRISSGLREQLHRAASAADMPSVQAWAERVLADGAAHSLTLEGRLADTISTEVRRSLAKALEAGWYEGAIADVESESGLT